MLNSVQCPSDIYNTLTDATDLHRKLKWVWPSTPEHSQCDSASLVPVCIFTIF